ncbi:hypothetical protein AYL99_10905 [Fonsecaea erecta]|uniref:Uncharacterized protein n=1 Tax=Fonsecaea erecta TaxID=1367422 RepID=A0A178Z838_9EURO|nr:hypothetical protein AYL99_10905 [Fonsecaea erecta]OAP55205.1 hypothetical protein AYL99_10905 [Fonsecaea erecta]
MPHLRKVGEGDEENFGIGALVGDLGILRFFIQIGSGSKGLARQMFNHTTLVSKQFDTFLSLTKYTEWVRPGSGEAAWIVNSTELLRLVGLIWAGRTKGSMPPDA